MMQSQAKAHESLSDTSVPTPLPVQLVLVSLPAGSSMIMRYGASPQSQPAESVSPNSLLVVVRKMKEPACTNGTSEPNLDDIEVEYLHAQTLRCAAHLQSLTLPIEVTSPIISHANECKGAYTANKSSRLVCKVSKKCMRWVDLMWGETLGVPTIFQGQPHAESSWVSRTVKWH